MILVRTAAALVLATLATAAPIAVATDAFAASEPPPGAASCSGCHPAGFVDTPIPRLVARPAAEIIEQMQAFKSGVRKSTVMDRIAKGYSDAEMAAIAAWYAEQK